MKGQSLFFALKILAMITKKISTSKLLFARAEEMGLQPSWVTPSSLFAVSTESGEKYVHYACSGLNSHVSSSLAKDKYLTRLILERNNLPNIPFASPKSIKEAESFLETHKKIIVKPRTGMGSFDIHIIEHKDQLQGINVRKYILEKYIFGREMRYLVFGGEVIAVHESEYGLSVQEDRELARISYPESDWDRELNKLSLKIASIMGLQFAAVDYLVDENNNAHILEVNTAPGLKWFHAPTAGPAVDVAKLFMGAFVGDISAV